jgi:hypothetical protein
MTSAGLPRADVRSRRSWRSRPRGLCSSACREPRSSSPICGTARRCRSRGAADGALHDPQPHPCREAVPRAPATPSGSPVALRRSLKDASPASSAPMAVGPRAAASAPLSGPARRRGDRRCRRRGHAAHHALVRFLRMQLGNLASQLFLVGGELLDGLTQGGEIGHYRDLPAIGRGCTRLVRGRRCGQRGPGRDHVSCVAAVRLPSPDRKGTEANRDRHTRERASLAERSLRARDRRPDGGGAKRRRGER